MLFKLKQRMSPEFNVTITLRNRFNKSIEIFTLHPVTKLKNKPCNIFSLLWIATTGKFFLSLLGR